MESFLNSILINLISNPLNDTSNKKEIELKMQTLYSKSANQLILFDEKTDEQKKRTIYSFIALSLAKQRKEKHFDISFVNESLKPIPIEIQSVILHPKNNNQICILNSNSLAFIQDVCNFTEKNSQIIVRHVFTDRTIIKVKFSYFDDIFGVLLSNNTFRIYSIQSSQCLVEITKYSFDSSIVDFSFCPYNKTNPYWERFMVYFIDKKGQLSLAGPFFPTEFKLNRIDFISMKHRLSYLNELSDQLYTALELSIVSNASKHLNDSNFYFKINYQLDNWNKHLSSRPLIIHNNLSYDYNKDISDIDYKQIELITSEPYVFLLRVTEDNRIEVIVLFETIAPIRNWYNLVTDDDNPNIQQITGNFLVEVIYLNQYKGKQSNGDSKPIRIIICDNNSAIIEENSNVYSIQFPYITLMSSRQFGEQRILYNSITKMILNSSNRKPITKKDKEGESEIKISNNYFLFEVINSEILISKIVDKKLVSKAIPLFNQSQLINSKSLAFPALKPQLLTISSVNEINKIDIKELKEELELVNHFEEKNVAFDSKGKTIQKALRTGTFENIINEQMSSFAKQYESLFNTQYDMLHTHSKTINQEIDLIEKSEVKKSHDQCLKQLNDINNEQQVIRSQTEEIKKLIGRISQKISDVNRNSKPVIKSIAIINTFQKEREIELNEMSSLLRSYDKQIKDIAIDNELNIGIAFNNKLISTNVKEQVSTFIKHIRSIKDLITQCLNYLQS